ncbi:MAG: glycogen synthase, partial [Candidatus Kariarchaeaceae archaeon]
MKILWLTSELDPFVKVGGLADVSNALPKAIALLNHDIRILMPFYGFLESFKESLDFICEIETPHLDNPIKLWKGSLPRSNVPIYFLEHSLTMSASAYGEIDDDNPDLALRFALLSWFSTVLPSHINWYPEILHCNDWVSAPATAFLRQERESSEVNTTSLLTIHNLAYQGWERSSALHQFGLDHEYLKDLTDNSDITNYLKLGIINSDLITTVSETYAKEIQTPDYGSGLDTELISHTQPIQGIVHGIDTEIWDPAIDENIPHTYDAHDLSGKSKCKTELQNKLNLPNNSNTFVVGLISRIVHQKGFDLLINAIPTILERDIQIIILGTGDREIENQLEGMQDQWGDKLSVNITYDKKLARLIFSGSDAFLIPSRYEPCGLTQLYSMQYGTVPIVHNVGGLADTVRDG